MPEANRQALLAALYRGAMRATGQSILFSEAIAEKVGMNSTDLECLGFLAEEGPATAGRLAELTGLTTGAATRMVDRLEKAGYVRRVSDPSDRRRVVVEPVPERIAALQPYYASLTQSLAAAVEHYTDEQMALLVEFFGTTEQVMQGEIRKVKELPIEAAAAHEFTAPLGDLREARLEFLAGISHARVTAGAPVGQLCHARFQGPRPRIRAQDGVVTLEYPRLSLADWARFALFDPGHPAADIALSPEVPWDIVCHGGASAFTAELSALQFGSLSITGGASQLDLTLGVPTGTALLVIDDGASKVSVRRPRDVPIRLRVESGASKVEFDGQGVGPVGKNLDLKTPGYDHAKDRYDLRIGGGASNLTIEPFDRAGSGQQRSPPQTPTTGTSPCPAV